MYSESSKLPSLSTSVSGPKLGPCSSLQSISMSPNSVQIGAILSSTVTAVQQVFVFPFASVTNNSTLTSWCTSSQPNTICSAKSPPSPSLLITKVSVPQASKLPPSISVANTFTEAVPIDTFN